MAHAGPPEDRIAAAHLKLRAVRERMFPPTWAEALRQLTLRASDSAAFNCAPSDLRDELLMETPHGTHGGDADEDFHTWFYCGMHFGKLQCLANAMSQAVTSLNLSEPSDATFALHTETADRILDATKDVSVALICLDVAGRLQDSTE